MGKIIRLTETQAARVKRLVRKQCANYDNGNCLLLDDGDFIPCPQLITRSLLCRYFINAVLPGDRQLCGDIFGSPYARPCRECGKIFHPKSDKAKYCAKCKPIVRRRQTRNRMRLKRGIM